MVLYGRNSYCNSHLIKGQFHRLGHGKDQNVTAPKKVNLPESIQSVSVGAFHVLCVGHSGKVYGWGDNEKNQVGVDSIDSVTKPVLIIPNDSNSSPPGGVQEATTVRVVAGPAQSVCWKVKKIPNLSWKILQNIPKQCSLLENWTAKQICLRTVFIITFQIDVHSFACIRNVQTVESYLVLGQVMARGSLVTSIT